MILAIARREWQASFLSAQAWGLLAANQFILAWIFLRVLEGFSGLEAAQRNAGVSLELSLNLFSFAAVLSLLSIPLLSMRDDQRGAARRHLQPARLRARVADGDPARQVPRAGGAGDRPRACCHCSCASGWSFATDLDLGLLATATLGLWLTGLMFAAVGLFASSLTPNRGSPRWRPTASWSCSR